MQLERTFDVAEELYLLDINKFSLCSVERYNNCEVLRVLSVIVACCKELS